MGSPPYSPALTAPCGRPHIIRPKQCWARLPAPSSACPAWQLPSLRLHSTVSALHPSPAAHQPCELSQLHRGGLEPALPGMRLRRFAPGPGTGVFPSWCTGSRVNSGRPPGHRMPSGLPFNRHGAGSQPHFPTPGATLNNHRSHSNTLKPWRACVSKSAGKTGTKGVPEGGWVSAGKDSSELGP